MDAFSLTLLIYKEVTALRNVLCDVNDISHYFKPRANPLHVLCLQQSDAKQQANEIMRTLRLLLPATFLLPGSTSAFGVLPDLPSVTQAFLPAAQNLLDTYQHALQTDALRTQVETGVALAIVGDAIAQKTQTSDEPYDAKRAAAFALFDSCYRAVQHYVYPPMIAICNGAFLSTFLPNNQKFAAAMEQSLVSQVVIIPIIYYPVFFALTGAVQGLTIEETIERAKETIVPLMIRNWLFWIPVQFAVFGFVPDEAAQISLLIACGLVWTVILSAFAGSTKEYSYCVTGMEDECILPEELFPMEEMALEIEEIEHGIEEKVGEFVHDVEVALHLENDNGAGKAMNGKTVLDSNGKIMDGVKEEEKQDASKESEEVFMK